MRVMQVSAAPGCSSSSSRRAHSSVAALLRTRCARAPLHSASGSSSELGEKSNVSRQSLTFIKKEGWGERGRANPP